LSGIAQGTDEGTVRQTYGSDREGLAGVADETWNTIKSKIPGARSTLPAALDNLGRERQTTATPLQNWLNSNLLPGSLTQYSTDRVSQEIERQAENGASVPNRSAEKKFTQDGQDYELNNQQQRNYQRAYGQTVQDGTQALLNSALYQGLTRDEQAAAMDALLNFSKQTARKAVFPNYELDSAAQKAQEAQGAANMTPAEYLVIASSYLKYDENGSGKLDQKELQNALDSFDYLTDEQRAALFALYNRGWKSNPYR